jgi:acyl carrier protein
MTAEPTHAGLDHQRVLQELTGMVLDVTGEGGQWAAGVSAASRLEGDLHLDSLEFAALGELLRQAYGDQADLAAFVAELDIDEIIGLTIGDLAAQVCGSPAGIQAGIHR